MPSVTLPSCEDGEYKSGTGISASDLLLIGCTHSGCAAVWAFEHGSDDAHPLTTTSASYSAVEVSPQTQDAPSED